MLVQTIRLALAALVFFGVGELVVRFDEHFEPLERQHEVMVATTVAETNELELIDRDELPINDNSFRVMILGDSFMYGAGVGFDEKVSQQLKGMLTKQGSGQEVYVLDLSRPSNNVLDNHDAFEKYFDRFQPDVVVMGYHMNDILKQSAKDRSNEPTTEDTPVVQKPKPRSLSVRSAIKKVYGSSRLVYFVSRRSQNFLRTQGVEIPAGEFHYFTRRAYKQHQPLWQESVQLVGDIHDRCEAGASHLIVYKFPSFHLLHHQHFFQQMDDEIARAMNDDLGVDFVNGKDDFDADNYEDYMLSKYDGHPNAVAHHRIAESLCGRIRQMQKDTSTSTEQVN
jgi:hypothetical protein